MWLKGEGSQGTGSVCERVFRRSGKARRRKRLIVGKVEEERKETVGKVKERKDKYQQG